jgi:uncharacterized protein DUF3175
LSQPKKHDQRGDKNRGPRGGRSRAKQLWSARVTQNSDALDLENHVFAQRKPSDIAQSLKRSAERSRRRKSSPFRSAMSMLNFYINRAGKNLSAAHLRTLDRAKEELRKAFGREKQ